MNIFGTMERYTALFKPGWNESRKIVGAFVASFEYLKAIIKYGSFDEYHFYLSNQEALKSFEAMRQTLNLPADKANKMFPKLFSELATLSKTVNYTVFSHSNPFLHRTAYLREQYFRSRPFPISGLVHSISGPSLYKNEFLANVLSPTRAYDAYICPSEAVRKALKKYLRMIAKWLEDNHGMETKAESQFSIIPLGIDTELYQPRNKKKLRSDLELPQDKTIITYVGRISSFNKMELTPLLHAFKLALANAKNKDLLLLFVGKEQLPGYMADLKTIAQHLGIADQVRFLEDFNNKDIPLYYSASDIFVSIPDNVQETFGLTPLEAMSSGLPVIVSDWNGYKESVEHGVNGFKVPTYWSDCCREIEAFTPLTTDLSSLFWFAQSVAVDINLLAEAMIKLADDEDLRTSFGRQGRQEVLKHYDWRVVVPQIEKLWFSQSDRCRRSTIERKFSKPFKYIPYFKIFDHYPTALLNENTKVKLSAFGESFVRKEEKLPIYQMLSNHIDPVLFPGVLTNTAQWITIRKLSAILHSEKGSAYQKMFYQIMFLLKNNLLVCKK